ncbi:hypothetical protein BDDG_07597 [Blastomyces dermatitidis ATCC 18188]|uniref:Uncharacterized protein n=1 Tax=Ajellomyces dermatitidis (strain ATCC 18188 / CBS 674.68) TaxID=653446 RepID=F2TN39_AJEDA|nr:hypothetical protein BDDG_07597 [Blastomyces dermatitidis ATCC 18188]EQL36836.1 hypothetical protein BDFG_01790 [Blastomyces dermatitidis ATCC 26199]
MQRINDRLARHDLKLSSNEALLSRRYRRSLTPGMDTSELSIVSSQRSASEGQYPSRTGSLQTTNIRFADSLPVGRPDRPRTRLENPYAPPRPQHNPHPHVQSMIIRKSRSFIPPSIPTDLSSRSITPSPSGSPKPLPPYPQEGTKNRPNEMNGFNKPSPPVRVASDASSSASATSINSSSNSSTSTQVTEPTVKSESQCDTPTVKIITPDSTPKDDKEAPRKQPRLKKNLIPPLTKIHFSCYQSHRYLSPSNNIIYPVPCMACLNDDQLIRWRCTFCCLRICGDCMQTMQKCKRRSLKELMERLVAALESVESA